MTQLELIKQLEYLIAFQTNCLLGGNWETFDKAEDTVKSLEEKILTQCSQDKNIRLN